ncbi:MAG: RAD55 family ATPase [Halobacteriaceae archaeon]
MHGGAGELLLEGLPREGSVLVAGPPLTGKYRLMLELLAERGDSVVVVTTGRPTARVIEDYREVAGDVPGEAIGVVDCVSHDERTREVPESETVRYVNSPQNLTRIGVAFTEILSTLADRGGHIGVGLHSVSALSVYSDAQTVYKFLQVFTGQAASQDAVCVAVYDTGGDTEQRSLVEQHFDCVVETRENDAGERELRVRGVDAPAGEWRRF